jgi:putative acetyltransferase
MNCSRLPAAGILPLLPMESYAVEEEFIHPSACLRQAGTCELVKMYLQPGVRGKGLGRAIIEKCLAFAAEEGYEKVYIETMPELRKAMSVYERAGFRYLDAPMGNTGHFGCEVWMLKQL